MSRAPTSAGANMLAAEEERARSKPIPEVPRGAAPSVPLRSRPIAKARARSVSGALMWTSNMYALIRSRSPDGQDRQVGYESEYERSYQPVRQ